MVSFSSPKSKQYYHELPTVDRRTKISALLAEGYSQAGIARVIGVHPSSISRELARNRSEKGYEPALVQQLTADRKNSAAKYKVSQKAVIFAELMLEYQWSPEQISNVGAMIGLALFHEWVYQYVAQDKANGGELYKNLREGCFGRAYRDLFISTSCSVS
ncbi:helix-turn-helix domain-containing protein [Shewanella sp. Scap07]|uniref:helix-turn-helix domain-containing protein n=1 Tax=Shewanella sp. Scap07 TaxID=2589987 RepID=UPI0015B78EF8|nr:helix-turn-helix domain-containing protein [Shewanella sp. Scap07]